MPKMCEDSTEDDIHPAKTPHSAYCDYHSRLRRSLASTASRQRARARARGEDPSHILTPTPSGPRPPEIRATAPGLQVTRDGTNVVLAIPREILDQARRAFAAEEVARNDFSRTKSRENADALAVASLRLSQAVDPLLYAEGLPDG